MEYVNELSRILREILAAGSARDWNRLIELARANRDGKFEEVEVKKIREDYCLQYGRCNRSHGCIRGIEAMNRLCLDCKAIALKSCSSPTLTLVVRIW